MKITRKAGKIESLKAMVKALWRDQSKVGWFESAKYEKGEPVAGVAFVQEHGSPKMGIPPRPFFRTTVEEKRNEWAKNSAQLAKAAALGQFDPKNVMEAIGMKAEGDVRETITKIMEPPLSKATIAARKRRLANGGAGAQASIAKPLDDTGVMLNTLTTQVKKK